MTHEPKVYASEQHGLTIGMVDPDAVKVVRRLRENGHVAFVVGGAVRDLLLKRSPKDFDVATDATPEQMRHLFRNSRLIGRRFQIVHVYFRDRKVIEVSTFRRDADGPDEAAAPNNLWGTAEDDARRRDLTINAFFLDPETMAVHDYLGGMGDLERSTIRVIGDPAKRFREDPVRMIRTIRHAARTGFLVEPETWGAIVAGAQLIADCNPSRVRQEFVREFQEGAAARSLKLLHKSGLLTYLLPELAEFLDGLHSRHDMKRTYWKLLDQLDREGATHDLPASLIFATALGPAIDPELLGVFVTEGNMDLATVQRRLDPFLVAAGVPRALAEPLAQTLSAQPRLDLARKTGSVPKRLAAKSYFPLAMHLFRMRHRAIGSYVPEEWEARLPSLAKTDLGGKIEPIDVLEATKDRERGGERREAARGERREGAGGERREGGGGERREGGRSGRRRRRRGKGGEPASGSQPTGTAAGTAPQTTAAPRAGGQPQQAARSQQPRGERAVTTPGQATPEGGAEGERRKRRRRGGRRRNKGREGQGGGGAGGGEATGGAPAA